MQCFLVLIFSSVVSCQKYYDVFTGTEINKTRYEEMDRYRLVPVCATSVAPCDLHESRRMNLSCNNIHYPARGAAMTPFMRMLPPVFGEGGRLRRAKSGNPLPLVRPLRVALMSDGNRPHKRFSQLLVDFNVFVSYPIDPKLTQEDILHWLPIYNPNCEISTEYHFSDKIFADVASVHDTTNYIIYTRTCCQPGGEQNPRCLPIKVLDDDLHLRRSSVRCMNLTRAITYQDVGCVQDTVPRERINLAAPMLELSSVYGHDEYRARRAREWKWGRLKADVLGGKEWPPSGAQVCINNVPPRETRCHDIPILGGNSLLGINILTIWFYRSHNAIADALRKYNPCWDDNKLYHTAREINVAFYLQIMYYELLPELFGWDFLVRNNVVFETEGHVNDYDPSLEPRLTIEFTVAGRWFHTLQPGTLNLYKPDGRVYGSIQVVDWILRTGALAIDGNLAGITQGIFRDPSAALDDVVDPDIGERVLGSLQFASDVISSDMMKGRDLGLPPYNHYREACGLPVAKTFKDLYGWMDRQQVLAMASFYEHPDDIDLYAAMLAEKPMPGAELGPTIACIMTNQLLRWRRADRFWYEHTGHPSALTPVQLREIRKMTIGKLLCQHGDSVSAVQPRAFRLPGEGNEITDCSKYDMPDLSVFRDARCYPHPTSYHDDSSHPPLQNPYTTPHYEHSTLIDYLKLFETNQYKSVNNHKSNIGYPNIDLSQPILNYPNDYSDHADLAKLGYADPHVEEPFKPKSSLFPSENPKVNIYPNADPIDPSHKVIKAVSIPGYSFKSKSRDHNLDPNLHPAVTSQKYTIEEFLENYWQSSTANPFKAFLS